MIDRWLVFDMPFAQLPAGPSKRSFKPMMWKYAEAAYKKKIEADLLQLKTYNEQEFRWLKNNTHQSFSSKAYFNDAVKI